MADTFLFELVTPEKLFYSDQADLVEVPGSEGVFGVLRGHAPLISTLKPGVVNIHVGNQVSRMFVFGGVAEVTPERCTVLAENVTDLTNLTLAEAQARQAAAQAVLDKAVTEEEKLKAAAAYNIAESLVSALSQ